MRALDARVASLVNKNGPEYLLPQLTVELIHIMLYLNGYNQIIFSNDPNNNTELVYQPLCQPLIYYEKAFKSLYIKYSMNYVENFTKQ